MYAVEMGCAAHGWIPVTEFHEAATAGRKAGEWAARHGKRFRVLNPAGTVLAIKEPES